MAYILDKNNNPILSKNVHGDIIKLEYRYLEYNAEGYVVKIYRDKPTLINENRVAISDNINFEEGSEFDNYIVVQEVDQDNILTSSCMIRQPESVKFLRQERNRLVAENEQLKAENAQTRMLVSYTNADIQGLMDYLSELKII